MTPTYTESLISSVTGVFNALGNWFIETLGNFVDLFYNSTDGLTFVGIMALVGVGIAVVRMLFAIIASFVQLRGGN